MHLACFEAKYLVPVNGKTHKIGRKLETDTSNVSSAVLALPNLVTQFRTSCASPAHIGFQSTKCFYCQAHGLRWEQISSGDIAILHELSPATKREQKEDKIYLKRKFLNLTYFHGTCLRTPLHPWPLQPAPTSDPPTICWLGFNLPSAYVMTTEKI